MPPSTTASRWAALSSAVASFVSTLQARNLDVHVALVTFSENYTFGSYSAVESSLDVPLTAESYRRSLSEMTYLEPASSAGRHQHLGRADHGPDRVDRVAGRTVADRTVILFTDGVATTETPTFPPSCWASVRTRRS